MEIENQINLIINNIEYTYKYKLNAHKYAKTEPEFAMRNLNKCDNIFV